MNSEGYPQIQEIKPVVVMPVCNQEPVIRYEFEANPEINNQQLKDAEAHRETASKRVKFTSWFLTITAILGLAKSVHTGFTARTKAWKIINGEGSSIDEISEMVTRDEFALFDIFKILSVLGFFACLIIMLFGRWGFHATKW